jgi:type I restriction enzyme M protein
MLTGELRSKVDKIWETFWTGGVSNPLTVIEQFTYLLFVKRLDDLQTTEEQKANALKKPISYPVFTKDQEELRWSRFKHKEASEMYRIVSVDVFPFIKTLHGDQESAYSRFMKDAVFMIPTPKLLEQVVTMIDSIPMEKRDVKGDLYEYLLSKIATAGQNGQFRTPRHIIEMMVKMVRPTPEDTICDPACGTAGFLVGAEEYLRETFHGVIFHDEKKKAHFHNGMFFGRDFDATMLRIGAMNLMLHGIENPNIQSGDALSEDAAGEKNRYSVILANPPFKGSLDHESVAKDLLRTVKTKKTELLFLALFLRLLKNGGRCACIVPDGVVANSASAYNEIRKTIIDGHKLEAVISMPSGVFRPYAGVSTAVLVFTRTDSGGTDKVWFYDMEADGYSLDDKRTPLDATKHENDNLPDILARWEKLKDEKKRERTEQSFLVPVEEIRAKKYDLSINRYRKVIHEDIEYMEPAAILKQLRGIEKEIIAGLDDLEGMLKEGKA